MPVYTYRREDGTTFDIKQSFSDDPLTVDPATGQKVTRIVQSAGIIFKGSGFYVTDNKGATNGNGRAHKSSDNGNGHHGDNPAPAAETKTEAKAESKTADPA